MGFSVTATHVIIFIAAIAVATGVAAVVSSTTDLLQSGILEKSKQTSEKLRTDIKIVHVYATAANTTIYVLNSGSTVLNQSAMSVFIDGEWRSISRIDIVNMTTNIQNSVWDPQEVIAVNASIVSPGRHKAKVAIGGASDEYLFNR